MRTVNQTQTKFTFMGRLHRQATGMLLKVKCISRVGIINSKVGSVRFLFVRLWVAIPIVLNHCIG